jgi:hypothetical protein
MRRNRKAKIVATLGPASSDKKTIRALLKAGTEMPWVTAVATTRRQEAWLASVAWVK